MVERSWFYKNGLFYTILALVLLLHIILLAVRMYKEMLLSDFRQPERSEPAPPLKIKIQPRVVEDKKQIVQSEDPLTDEKPTDKSYLSDKNRKFDRETIARKVDIFKSAGKGQAGANKPSKDKVSLSDLGAFAKGHNPLKAASKIQAKPGSKTNNQSNQTVSSTNDFVDKVPLGDLTSLNSVEYKYYGFYHRIRQKLEQFWGRSIHEKAEAIMKAGRKVASNENLITSLQVTLNHLGKVVNIKINSTSGVRELDEAAVDSFNQAGPFPNPPKGLIRNGLVVIEWGFVVNT